MPIQNTAKGFTLVELAIVMIIIGLLIGGVIKGQALIENAQADAVLSQIESYRAATHSFYSTYEQLPGDFSQAQTRLQGCSAPDCRNGNGNSIIEPRTCNSGTAGNIPYCYDFPQSQTDEALQYWRHLVLANLITGVEPQPVSTPVAAGESHPRSSIRGTMHIIAGSGVDTGYCNTEWSGHWIRNQGPVSGTSIWVGGSSSGVGVQVISPIMTGRLDRKIDDGIACSGNFRGISLFFTNGCNTPAGGNYTNISQKNCLIMWRL